MSDTDEGPGMSGGAAAITQQITPYPICRLTETNYAAWSHKMQLLLKRESLWSVVEATPTPLTGENLQKDERAQAHIGLSVDDELLVHIRGLNTAKQCWDALKEIYTRQSVASKISLSRRLYNTKLEPGGDLRAHLRLMKKTLKDLEDVGVNIPELQKVLIVLGSLDSSWDVFALTLEAIPESTLTLPYITSRLLEEEEKRREHTQERRRERTHPSTAKTTEKEEAPHVYAARRCYCCGSTSHIQRYCKSKESRRRGKTAGRGKVAVVRTQDPEEGQWLIDSGASCHICCDPTRYKNLKPSERTQVSLANGASAKVEGTGKVYVPGLHDVISNVLCVPSLKQSLLSVSCLLLEGFTVQFKGKTCNITKGDKCIKVPMRDNLFILEATPKAEVARALCTNKETHKACAHLWHNRLAHINYKYIQKTAELARGINVQECNKYVDCHTCKQVKSRKAPVNKKSDRQSQKPFELVHADIVGPFKATVGGAKYFLLIVDDYSRFTFCYLLKEKREAFQKFRDWVHMIERRFNHKVAQLQTDRGGEFMSNAMKSWLEKTGIQHRTTNPYSPAENSVAERKAGVLQIMKDALLNQSKLSQVFWGEALQCATHLVNRVYSRSVDNIPYNLLYGKAPDLSYIRSFGAYAFVHLPKSQRKKGASKTQKLICVGYSPFTKGYRFLTKDKRNIVISRSANFCEQELLPQREENYFPTSDIPLILQERENELTKQHTPAKTDSEDEEHKPLTPSITPKAIKQETTPPIERSPIVQRRELPPRTTRGVPPQRFVVGEAVAYNVQLEPQKYEDILELPTSERKKWFEAMHQEMQAMKTLGVFTTCNLPPGKQAIGCRWVYRIKPQEGADPIYRARLVAKGFSQKKDIDYGEIFSPTVAAQTIRYVLALAAQRQWHVHHYDVQTAYLNATLEETLYMEQAPGFELPEIGIEQKVYQLNRSIYGLKQSARRWALHLKEKLESLGFKATKADACLFIKGTGTKQIIVICYVDDLLIMSADMKQIEHTAINLKKEFTLKALGPVKQYLGVEIEIIPKGFALHQNQKIKQLLETWRMSDCKPARTPMTVGSQIAEENTEQYPHVEQYKSLLGSLQHIALWTRPDICNAINILSRYSNNPSHKNWTDLKRVLRYLKGTTDLKLNITPVGELTIKCYVDSDWANDAEDRKSTSGNAIIFGNTLVDWSVKKQAYLALSTCESEFASISQLCTSLVWIKQLMKDLGIDQNDPITVYEDNMACIKLANSEKVKTRSKHVDIRYHNVRQAVQEGIITLNYCPTEENLADILTKPLSEPKFIKGVQMMGMK